MQSSLFVEATIDVNKKRTKLRLESREDLSNLASLLSIVSDAK
jgi:hypothetical protein